jgi:predicted exporter
VEPRRLKLVARLVLVAFAAGCALWLARLDYAKKISTNVLDLIPATERSPEIGLVRSFANAAQARVLLFALRDPQAPGTPPLATARVFAAALARSPAFADTLVLGDAAGQTELGRELFARRFELLLPSWLGQRERAFNRTGQPPAHFPAWLAEHAAADLEAFLSRPDAAAMQGLLPADPLLLVPALIDHAQMFTGTGATSSGGHALVWARMVPSPLTPAGQQPVFAAIAAAQAEAGASHPGIECQWSGLNRFAAASRAQIERELRLLNIFSLLAVLAVSCLFVRQVHKILHLVPVILLAIVGAWTVSTLVFDRLHILVFVIGSLLSGVAIDYGFYIYMQPSLRPDEPYPEKLRRLLKPLLASCLTTVIGFSLLLFSDLPLIRQIGLFVGSGLLCALAVAMLYFAQLDRPLLEGRAWNALALGRRHPAWRRVVRGVLFAALAIAVLGPEHLHWRDDVRQLDIPSPELHANEETLRRLFGDTTDRTTYLTYGNTIAEARQHLEDFLADEARRTPDFSATSLGLVLPTAADWSALPRRLQALAAFAPEFRAALERHGFIAASFAPFFDAWSALRANPPTEDYTALAAGLDEIVTGPMALLSNLQGPLYWFATLVDRPDAGPPPDGLFTVGVNQLQSLNGLFTRYRWSALRLSLVGLGLVIASVFALYPWRRGVRIALIPAGACFFVFGLLGLTGQTLNLFNLLGAFLGVCLSHNYAIFSSDNSHAGTAPPASIRLSGLSTAASFGVLAFSRIPVIHALGLTVASIVLTALVAVELEPLARRPRP